MRTVVCGFLTLFALLLAAASDTDSDEFQLVVRGDLEMQLTSGKLEFEMCHKPICGGAFSFWYPTSSRIKDGVPVVRSRSCAFWIDFDDAVLVNSEEYVNVPTSGCIRVVIDESGIAFGSELTTSESCPFVPQQRDFVSIFVAQLPLKCTVKFKNAYPPPPTTTPLPFSTAVPRGSVGGPAGLIVACLGIGFSGYYWGWPWWKLLRAKKRAQALQAQPEEVEGIEHPPETVVEPEATTRVESTTRLESEVAPIESKEQPVESKE